MIVDGLQILEGSNIINATLDSGATFPGNASLAELFYKTNNLDGQGAAGLYVYDGAAWVSAGNGAQGGSVSNLTIYDLGGGILGVPGDGDVVGRYAIVRPIQIAANLGGTVAKAELLPTATTVLTLKKNGTSFGTLTWAAGSAIATKAGTQTSFVSGDVLTIENQAVADMTFGDVEFTIVTALV